jgi:hypothetical protein
MAVTTFVWNNTATANWNQANQWNTGTIANGSVNNVAFINKGGAILSSNQTITNLTVNNGSLFLNAANTTLNVVNALTLNGTTGGLIQISNVSAMLTTSNFTEAGGTLNISNGNLTVNNNATVSNGNFNQSGGNVTVTKTLSVSGGTFNQSGGVMNVGNANFTGGTDTIGGTFGDAGTLNVGTTTLHTTLTIGNGAAVTITGLTTIANSNSNVAGNGSSISLAGGTLTLNGGLTFGGTANFGTITGFGTINGTGNINNAGTITASGGTLTVAETINSGVILSISNASASTLNIAGTAASAAAIVLNSANQTLQVGTGGALNIAVAETVAGGTLSVTGGTLTDTSGITESSGTVSQSGGTINLGTSNFSVTGGTFNQTGGSLNVGNASFNNGTENVGGTVKATGSITVGNNATINLGGGTLNATGGISDAGKISGFGTLTGAITGAGSVTASGGTLDITGNIANNSTVTFNIANSASSILKIDGTVGTGDTFTFLGNAGGIDFNNAGKLTTTISGLDVGTSATTPLDFIDILGGRTIVLSTNGFTGTSGSFTLSDGSVITLTNLGGATGGTWYIDYVSDGNGGVEYFLSTVVCFAAGTQILTADGERVIESLTQGDVVLALEDGELVEQPVKWLGRRRIDISAHPRPGTVAPVRIQRGAFADGMPHTDLMVSPDHAVFVEGKLICARQLINGTTIRQEMGLSAVEYFHVELDAHGILIAEGLPAESYLDTGNRGFFGNSDEPLVLHPDLTDEADLPQRAAGSCAPFVSDEADVKPVWQSLAARAAALGQPALQPETTVDADLRIIAKGRTLRPLYNENGLYIFVLPKGVADVRIVSRAAAPADTKPWLEDRRNLGVYVERISLRGVDEMRDIPLDHPGLTDGWWLVEGNGTAMRRWTDGDAKVSLPAAHGGTMLEIRASNTGLNYVVTGEGEDRLRKLA